LRPPVTSDRAAWRTAGAGFGVTPTLRPVELFLFPARLFDASRGLFLACVVVVAGRLLVFATAWRLVESDFRTKPLRPLCVAGLGLLVDANCAGFCLLEPPAVLAAGGGPVLFVA